MVLYIGLFNCNTYTIQDSGEIIFENISLMRKFPDEDFNTNTKNLYACLNPLNGTIFLYNSDVESITIKLSDWTHRISRTE